MRTGFLSGVRVLDLTDHRGLIAGRMLGQLGADVVQVEPAQGSPARRHGPFTDDPPPDNSLFWSAYACGKRGVALDIDADRPLLMRLVERADILIESEPPGAARRLDYAHLAAVNPRLIVVSITAFGQDGPKAGWAASDLTLWAAGGALFPARDGDGPPLRISVPQAWLHAGADAAGAALIALAERETSGLGQHVDISAQISVAECTLATMLADPVGDPRAAPPPPGGPPPLKPPRSSWPTLDGRVEMAIGVGAVGGGSTNALFAWMRAEGESDPRFDDWDWLTVLAKIQAGEIGQAHIDAVREVIARFFAARSCAEVVREALQRRILLTQIQTARTLVESDHYEGHGAFCVVVEKTGPRTLPHAYARLAGAFAPLRPAPRIGEHNDAVIADWLKSQRPPRPKTAPAPRSRAPLQGLKVLELAWVVAGPRMGRALADFGATVVRVDSAARTDPARVVGPYPGGVIDHARCALWDNCNAGKLGLALDLGRPQAREVVLDLAAWADVITESYAPGQMDRWGLGYEALKARNPALVMLSSCLMGQEGPLAKTAGFGNVGAAASGFQVLVGRPGADPIGPAGPYTDFVAPRFSLVLLLAALRRRAQTGEGMRIDFSQAEAGIQFIAPQIADYAATGAVAAANGNRDPGMAPHGVFACAGREAWLAVACEDDGQWAALAAVLGADLPRWRTLGGRKADEDALEAAVAAWAASRPLAEAEVTLQAAGVPAHGAAYSRTFCADPQIRRRRHIIERDGAAIEASRLALSATPPVLRGWAPPVGHDNRQVLSEFAGYDEARIAALEAAGVLR